MRIQAHLCFFPHHLRSNFLMGAKVGFSWKTCPAVPRGVGLGGSGGGAWGLLTGSGLGTPWEDHQVPCDLLGSSVFLLTHTFCFSSAIFPPAPHSLWGAPFLLCRSNLTFFFSSRNWTSAFSHLILSPRINPPSGFLASRDMYQNVMIFLLGLLLSLLEPFVDHNRTQDPQLRSSNPYDRVMANVYGVGTFQQPVQVPLPWDLWLYILKDFGTKYGIPVTVNITSTHNDIIYKTVQSWK